MNLVLSERFTLLKAQRETVRINEKQKYFHSQPNETKSEKQIKKRENIKLERVGIK